MANKGRKKANDDDACVVLLLMELRSQRPQR